MFKDMLKGFAVTAKHIVKKPVTINYPEERRPQPQWWRGRHRLQRYENGLERCVACCLCAAVCPSAVAIGKTARIARQRSPARRWRADVICVVLHA